MPSSMRNSPPTIRYPLEPVREKAVEIANAVLTRGDEEGRAIRIGNSAEFS